MSVCSPAACRGMPLPDEQQGAFGKQCKNVFRTIKKPCTTTRVQGFDLVQLGAEKRGQICI